MAQEWTHESFAAYVREREAEESRNPDAYRRKVVGLVGLGYAYVLLLILASIGLCVGIVVFMVVAGRIYTAAIKIAFFLVIFAFGLIASLFVKIPKPEGMALTSADAEPLFLTVERLQESLGAPKFSQILLTNEFNAAAAQRPRFGLFGGYQSYLIVGLPLMQALSPEQFESVLAHELGHLRGGHGRFGAWTYRVHQTWAQLQQGGTGLLVAFANWYFPKLNAYTFPLRRQNEYEADRCAAEAATARIAADALCALPLRSEYLQKAFYEPLSERVRQSPQPPNRFFSEMGHALRQPGFEATPDAARALRDALLVDTDYDDSHPALKDRLKALGEEPRVPETPSESAAERFFGASLPRLTETLDAEWVREVAESWRVGHEKARAARENFEGVRQKLIDGTELTPEERLEYAHGVESYEGAEAALPLYRVLFELPKVGDYARFAVGRILIEHDEPEAVALLEQVRTAIPASSGDVLALLRAYHKRQGDEASAQRLYTEHLRFADQVNAAHRERTSVTAKDVFVGHALSDEKREALRATLATHAELQNAYLIEKKLEHFTEDADPYLILVVVLRKKFYRADEAKDYNALCQSLNQALEELVVLPAYGEFAWLKGRAEQLSGALIYQASR